MKAWTWNSSSHPISDIRDWSTSKRLEIRPDFQRKEVWSLAAKIMLMDSVLRNIPMPKVFLKAIIREADTYRVVIDGQQRINAILSFIRDDFALGKPYAGEHSNKNFSQLPSATQEEFLSYKIDINEIRNATDDVIRDIYSRVNKYTVALNKQELRRADYPGDFLKMSEALALNTFFDEGRIFTVANSKRMGDVEFVSELIALLIGGVQDKKETLDDFYKDYSEWDRSQQDATHARFQMIISDLYKLFDDSAFPIARTRFRQKADFYSLFAAMDDCHQNHGCLRDDSIPLLRKDLVILNEGIEPESDISLFSEYAVKCVSQGNTIGSRAWRCVFLRHFLHGAYFHSPPAPAGREQMREILIGSYMGDPMCPPQELMCPICMQEGIQYTESEKMFLTWRKESSSYQLSNAEFIHVECKIKAADHYFIFEENAR